ncbi:hypothetical protein EDD18DRAFT_1100408 [Armillaria luteobubalina]|uniref:Uncharacterized protein n=1 Tax=Armillaria luteobubalina TaxID=153913 RepID=A0AA39QIK0_9AGAR|nr:hypothetical protein EDD18DRAFT_1100408 [Armillaria luteobubalina]
MSVNDKQAQMNWARHFLPLYRSIRCQDTACLNAFLYGLFAAYMDRFRGTLCTKLGTPAADFRDPTSLGQWRRKALKMLSDLLQHLDVTEPTTSLPLPLPSSTSLAIDPSSSNVPENATASGAITSSLPTPRLILVPHRQCSVWLVGKSRDTTQDTSVSAKHTSTSMAAVIAQQDDSVCAQTVPVASEERDSVSRVSVRAPSKTSLVDVSDEGKGHNPRKRSRQLDEHQVTPSKKPCNHTTQ